MFEENKQNKIFGRRKGKNLSNLQKENLIKYLNDFSIFPSHDDNKAKFKKINPYNLFHDLKIMDIRLEIGFGMGDSLLDFADKHPAQFWVGVEVYHACVESVIWRAKANDLQNIALCIGDIFEILPKLLEEL